MTHPDFSKISNLLIDLGGVLLQLDFPAMNQAFSALRPNSDHGVHYALQTADDIFHQLEVGAVSEMAFVSGLRGLYNLEGTDPEILDAWKKILGPPFPGREEAIARLRPFFQMALLSNTNQIHFDTFEPACRPIFTQLDRLFVSHEMGLRKPQPQIYVQALEEMGWEAASTLFIDDTPVNIKAARELGIQTYWLPNPAGFDDLVTQLVETKEAG